MGARKNVWAKARTYLRSENETHRGLIECDSYWVARREFSLARAWEASGETGKR